LDDEEMPRRRRAKEAVVEMEAEHGLLLRLFLYSPKDMIAGAIALAAVIAILTNALLMQAGRHPAPMFGMTTITTLPAVASAPASPMPRPRPAVAEAAIPEAKPPVESKIEMKAEGKADPRAEKGDPLTNLVKTTSSVQATNTNIPRPPMSVPLASSHRVAAVQRALNEYGYGQLKPTGVLGPDTQSAIQRFERTRKFPVTGQVSDRLVRELASVTGRPVE
jgi:hypothetical protein